MPMSVLDYHEMARAHLLCRIGGCDRYLQLLYETANIPQDSIISTAEHLAPFNVAETVSFILPQLTLSRVRAENGRIPIVLLAGSLVPMDNLHHPRGFLEPA